MNMVRGVYLVSFSEVATNVHGFRINMYYLHRHYVKTNLRELE
jgi:hypothetical protein